MKRVLDDIQTGKFARDWVLENKAGQASFKATRARAAAHPIEEVGAKLRAMMPWIAKNKLVDQAKNYRAVSIDCIDEIPGAAELSDWFGGFPSFHDGYAQLQLCGEGTGWLKVRAARMTERLDENGRFVLEKRFTATLFFEEIKSVTLTDFMPGEIIIGQLDFRKMDGALEVDFDTAYGLAGTISARHIRIEFEPTPIEGV
jgi:hypothetical protein